MIVVFEGFLNSTATLADWPAARLPEVGTVMNGNPPKLPEGVVMVTPFVKELKTSWKGPSIGEALILAMVTVPLKV